MPKLARSLTQPRAAWANVLVRVEELVKDHPLHVPLKTLPRVGFRTQARIFPEVSGKDFTPGWHLASYAGLAPVTRRSVTSIRGDHSSRK